MGKALLGCRPALEGRLQLPLLGSEGKRDAPQGEWVWALGDQSSGVGVPLKGTVVSHSWVGSLLSKGNRLWGSTRGVEGTAARRDR